ncbi:hypothetical protein ACLOJK_022864 [Asimina triloba]
MTSVSVDYGIGSMSCGGIGSEGLGVGSWVISFLRGREAKVASDSMVIGVDEVVIRMACCGVEVTFVEWFGQAGVIQAMVVQVAVEGCKFLIEKVCFEDGEVMGYVSGLEVKVEALLGFVGLGQFGCVGMDEAATASSSPLVRPPPTSR